MWQKEIWMADLEPIKGREQGGRRLVVIISGNTMNEHYAVRIICPLSSQVKNFAGCVLLKKDKINRLPKDSEVLTFQLRTISTSRLIKKIGQVTPEQLRQIRLFLNEILTY
ncbi:MAG: type II toxin-antitoxin system PemK/MazF family toxin [Bacteroidota bacterium]